MSFGYCFFFSSLVLLTTKVYEIFTKNYQHIVGQFPCGLKLVAAVVFLVWPLHMEESSGYCDFHLEVLKETRSLFSAIAKRIGTVCFCLSFCHFAFELETFPQVSQMKDYSP